MAPRSLADYTPTVDATESMYPPPPSPSPPPYPSPPFRSNEIDVTFGLSIVSVILLVAVVLSLFAIMAKLHKMYVRIEASDAEKAGPAKVGAGGAVMATHAKLAHSLAIIVSMVIALFVGIVLADGTSVIKVKPVDQLDRITNPDYLDIGLDYRIDELLGETYGVGLHHDQAGHCWNEMSAGKTLKELEDELGVPVVIAAVPSVIATDDLKHPVKFLKCDDLEMAGLTAMCLGFIAEIVAGLMVIFHTLTLAGLVPGKIAKPLGALVWLTLTSGFLIVVCLATGIYTAEWTCDNTFIPSIVLSDHFDYNYGFGFAIAGYVSCLLVLFTVFMVTSTADGTSEGIAALSSVKMTLVKIVSGVVVGMTVASVICLIIMGSNDAFKTKTADPDVNPCKGQKPYHAGPGDHYFHNTDCLVDDVTQTLEQAGGNVTRGYVGGFDAADRVPITEQYSNTDLCPVNVHWHLGAEHLSVGEYDEYGTGPALSANERDTLYDEAHHSDYRRKLADGTIRLGGRCHHYDAADTKFTTEFDWQHCTNMKVGETYEIHWPHSAAGACGTKWQYQSPFYDGVFCHDGVITIAPLNTYDTIGVEGQIFTVVNDEMYYVDDLIHGMHRGTFMGQDMGSDIAKYTGSTTGTSRTNDLCSRYTPITWQVDRKCHMISASSFDKMCKDMLAVKDDMSGDVYPHGARELVDHFLSANNQQTRKK